MLFSYCRYSSLLLHARMYAGALNAFGLNESVKFLIADDLVGVSQGDVDGPHCCLTGKIKWCNKSQQKFASVRAAAVESW